MSDVITFVTNLTPMGAIGLLALIIYLQVKTGRQTALISDNHLSGLPDMQASLDRTVASLERIASTLAGIEAGVHRLEERQVRAGDQLTWLLAKTNGGSKPLA